MTNREWPFVSVIMPVRNEADFIEESLGAVLAQDYTAERMEVLVVDGRSDDMTRDLVRRQAARDGRARLLDNPGRDQASALNIGIAQARGEIIVRVDGHGRIPGGYVKACVKALEASGADNVGGQMRAVGTTPLAEAIALATSSPFGVGGSRFHYSDRPGDTDTVYLGAFRHEVFDRVGLFDPAAVPNEDYEFNYRLRANGGRVYYTPEIWAWYYVRPSMRGLACQYFRYGWRKAFVIRRHPGSVKVRHLVAPMFVAALLVGVVGAWIQPWLAWELTAVLGSYLLAVSLASLRVAAGHGWRHLVWLPLIFATIHLSWGSGFLASIASQIMGRKG
jgi:succinoglycan biosynthesis protein ExoA